MKQGRASFKGPADRKVEPNPKVANPGGADREGQALGSHTMSGDMSHVSYTPLYGDRGYSAPSIGKKHHSSGSQGKY